MPAILPLPLKELCASGRIIPESLQPVEGGNRDRRAPAHSLWRTRLPDGRQALLRVGADLSDHAAKHAAFARACPSLVPALLFQNKDTLFAVEYFDGGPLETAGLEPARATAVMDHVIRLLVSTAQSSSESARLAEWSDWTAALLARNWSPPERNLLETEILPRLYQALSAESPTTRWSNGDFIASNILLDRDGRSRLIDTEFAGRTHFWREDAVRFLALSPLARRKPAPFVAALPEAGPCWHLFCWLRQWMLEQTINTDSYVAKVRAHRLGLIRRLAEVLLDLNLDGWSQPSLSVRANVETARWSTNDGQEVEFHGWCHVPGVTALRTITLDSSSARLSEASLLPRPDVQAHFAAVAGAPLGGFACHGAVSDSDGLLFLSAVTDDGCLLPFHRIRAGDLPGRVAQPHGYPHWSVIHNPAPPPSESVLTGPLISILLPVYRTPPDLLRHCLDSVLRQHYQNWELCVVDDASDSPEIDRLLAKYSHRDQRIRLLPRATNGGIARATNDCLAAARGEYAALLDHDDELRPHALSTMAQAIAENPAADLFYSDEEKITAESAPRIPFLKPGYSPEFFLGVMYFGHLLVVRTRLVRDAGGFDSTYDGVQDYEFALRLTERTQRIVHVPQILYRWRQTGQSSSLHGNIKGDMDAHQAAAVTAHLRRIGRTERAISVGGHRVRLDPSVDPKVAVVRAPSAAQAVPSLLAAARTETAEVLLLLCEDTHSPTAPDLRRLAASALRPDTGLVAPVLHSHDGRVLDAGWIAHAGNFIPLLRGFDPDGDGYNGTLRCTREVTGLAPQCVVVARERLATLPTNLLHWTDLLAELARAGCLHRIVGGTSAAVPVDWRSNFPATPCPGTSERYYHRYFDPKTADYNLRTDLPAATPHWHLDDAPATGPSDGCLQWRGWCHWPGRTLREIRLELRPDFFCAATQGLPRPDVARQLGIAAATHCGLEARVRLPIGRYSIVLWAVAADGATHLLGHYPVNVTSARRLRYALAGDAAKLLAFQFLAGPSQKPCATLPRHTVRSTAKSNRPHFAIVTPSFQQVGFLAQCLSSVLEQEGVMIRYVVKDGGSTDGSRELIAARASQLHSWSSGADGGQSAAIRAGFAEIDGRPDDLMAWLNSDDFYLPGSLAKVADYFARHPEVDVVYGHRCVVDKDGRWIGNWILPPHCDAVLRLNDFVPQETMFWRRRVWERIGGLDPTLRFAMDWDLLLRFQEAGARFARLPWFIASFRVHPDQKTTAAMHSVGQQEIDWLRARAHGRYLDPAEFSTRPELVRYLRRSARQEWLGRFGPRRQ